jgi:hypothetical protein
LNLTIQDLGLKENAKVIVMLAPAGVDDKLTSTSQGITRDTGRLEKAVAAMSRRKVNPESFSLHLTDQVCSP